MSGLWEPLATVLSSGKVPVLTEKILTLNETDPVSDEKTPVQVKSVPTQDRKVPTQDKQVSTQNGKVPTQVEKTLTQDGKISTLEENALTHDGKVPGAAVSDLKEKVVDIKQKASEKVRTKATEDERIVSEDIVKSLSTKLRELALTASVSLSLPTVPRSYIQVTIGEEAPHSVFPFTSVPQRLGSQVFMATVTNSRQLTNEGALKRTLEITLSIPVSFFHTCIYNRVCCLPSGVFQPFYKSVHQFLFYYDMHIPHC